MRDIGTLTGDFGYSIALGTNADGTVVVGSSTFPGSQNPSNQHAFRWTTAGMVDIDPSGTYPSIAFAVSADGSVIIGTGAGRGGFRWTSGTGIKDLNVLLADARVNMAGITLDNARAVSANGQLIVGNGSFPEGQRAYLIRYYDGTPAVSVTPIAGLTSVASVQQSVNDLAAARAGAAAQSHGFAAPCSAVTSR